MTSLTPLAEKTFLTHYHVFLRLASQFIPQIAFYPGDKVLDIGCRNGKVTGAVAQLNPDCHFTAITTSAVYWEAIEKDKSLQSLPNVLFKQTDPYELDFHQAFDKVISFSCLTWYQERDKIIKNIFNSLKPGGKAYIQLFVDHGQDWFDACVFAVAQKKEWASFFQDFKKRVTHTTPGVLLSQAERTGFIIEQSKLSKHYIPIKNEDYFKNWMISWSSHLPYLPENKVDAFFNEAVETYLLNHPKDKKGQFNYDDYFLEMVLLKPLKV